jgi:predicted CXXCH cytochrome family protein
MRGGNAEMKKWFNRLLSGLLVASPMVFVSYMVLNTEAVTDAAQATEPACENCHEAFVAAWESGRHATATSNTEFLEVWEAQNRPASCMACHATGFDEEAGTWVMEEITCIGCHDASAANHPMEPMTANRSPDFCGSCHTETHFDWEASEHRSSELGCISCHDPHGTELKTGDASSLCTSCHGMRASSFAHTPHSEVGITCADCHLESKDVQIGEGRSLRDHSFHVRLSTCNECHVYDMHAAQEVVDPGTLEPDPTDAMASVESVTVSTDPNPVSPVGFASLAGLIGMASGMILTPWLERWFRRMKREGE